MPASAAGYPIAPSSPPATLAAVPAVQFYAGGDPSRDVVPLFAGLSAGSVGLYQVNVNLPTDSPKGITNVRLLFGDAVSNSVPISIQ